METNRKRLIVVLGMHRSGTSVVTRALQTLGVDLGDRLMPPKEGDNDKGYYEDMDLYFLNEEMLYALNSDWHRLTPILQSDVDVLREKGYLMRAVDILGNKTSGTRIFGFKDPRVAKLLPFWREVFAQSDLKVGYVIMIRHPLSVSRSLEKRLGFELEKNSLLWLEHVMNSLDGTVGEDHVLVDYDRLIQLPEMELKRMAQELHLQIALLELEKFKTEFLDEGLRHTIYQTEDLAHESMIHPLIREVYSTLISLLNHNLQLEDAAIKNKITRWKNELTRLMPVLVFIDKLNVRINDSTKESTEQTQILKEQINKQNAQIHALEIQLNDITKSKSWRAILLFRRTIRFLAPKSK